MPGGVPLPVKLNRALLDSDLHIAFEQPKDAAPKLRITGGLSLRDLDLREASDESLAAWQALNVRGVDALPLERQVRIGEVELVEPNIQTRRYADQRINWLDAIDKLQRLGAGARTEGPSPVSTVKTASAPPASPSSATPAPSSSAAPASPSSAAPAAPSSAAPATPSSVAPARPSSATPATSSSATPGPATPSQAPPAPLSSATQPPATQPPATPAPAAAADPDPWRVNVDKVSIVNGKLRLRDASTRLDHALDKLSASVTHVQLPQPKDQPIAIELGAENPDGAALHASGGVILQPLALNPGCQGRAFAARALRQRGGAVPRRSPCLAARWAPPPRSRSRTGTARTPSRPRISSWTWPACRRATKA